MGAACDVDTWSAAGAASCEEQTTCGQGEKISDDSKTATRTCSACDAGKYQGATSHRISPCAGVQPSTWSRASVPARAHEIVHEPGVLERRRTTFVYG